jgi:RimJ/RimL family protein N-acetyltransferase
MSAIAIRPLHPEEWPLFRDFRLFALRSSPGVFSGTLADAEARPEQAWRALIAGPGHQIFGLFDGATLIGITAVFTEADDPSGGTANLAMSFIHPDYRARGLSRLFYEARLDWIRARPQFRRVTVGHRESNEASRRANQHHGFTYTGRKSRLWPDGTVEDDWSYELLL